MENNETRNGVLTACMLGVVGASALVLGICALVSKIA